MMATFDLATEITLQHPEDPDVTLTLRWTDRSRLGPSGTTRGALADVLATFGERAELPPVQR